MKKFATLLTAIALLGSTAQAQNNSDTSTGRAAAVSTASASEPFAWGIALGALVVIGVVVGIVASTAAEN